MNAYMLVVLQLATVFASMTQIPITGASQVISIPSEESHIVRNTFIALCGVSGILFMAYAVIDDKAILPKLRKAYKSIIRRVDLALGVFRNPQTHTHASSGAIRHEDARLESDAIALKNAMTVIKELDDENSQLRKKASTHANESRDQARPVAQRPPTSAPPAPRMPPPRNLGQACYASSKVYSLTPKAPTDFLAQIRNGGTAALKKHVDVAPRKSRDSAGGMVSQLEQAMARRRKAMADTESSEEER
ncbi:hypothetical protein J8273_6157 [Carpediemonas membranifera]|uniref:Uncharacterized protein n=1 Tax=Carpediemonas membranifera TaxID=201153 RepID=A0A8J6B272_9EUKA|nr:hypothetical protein J8273_6157 [Carpediemonas membranifera]|eukprot:KAG9391397.1 hypothetical protein J8273_6157 [Carpediemonas membranifera]